MYCRIVSLILLSSCFIVGPLLAEDALTKNAKAENAKAAAPVSHKIKSKIKSEPALIIIANTKGETVRSNIDKLVLETPPAILKSAKDWTDISDHGKEMLVTFIHSLHSSKYLALSFGDEYSMSVSIKQKEKTLVDLETHVRYKETFNECDEKKFRVWGVFEFDNQVTKRKCFVLCQVEGLKTPSIDPKDLVIHPTGTVTWTGPLLKVPKSMNGKKTTTAKKQ
ncbi:MAG: hypothetical protein COA78_19210 [Blastopirellula sp.]|nr:MAG: hypothetical protein COA78_19210 [Blastopirellula sp.]